MFVVEAKVDETKAHAVLERATCNAPSQDFVEHLNYAIRFRSSNEISVQGGPSSAEEWHVCKQIEIYTKYKSLLTKYRE